MSHKVEHGNKNKEERNTNVFVVQSSSSPSIRHRCAGSTLEELHCCVRQEFEFNESDILELRTACRGIIIGSDKALEFSEPGEYLIVCNQTKGETFDTATNNSVCTLCLRCGVHNLPLMQHVIDASDKDKPNIYITCNFNTQVGDNNTIVTSVVPKSTDEMQRCKK